jgi:DNA-binding MarR family transcriptional regulator
MPFLHDSAIGFVVGRTSHILRNAFRTTFSAAGQGITPDEWGILNRLWEQDGQRPADLAEVTIRDRSTVTRLLDGMVKKGLVRREVDPNDRRALRTWLTPDGRKLRNKLIPVVEGLLSRTTRGIPESDLRTTVKTLRKFQANLIDLEGDDD